MDKKRTADDYWEFLAAHGGLLDLYVTPASISDWNIFMDFVSTMTRDFHIDGQPGELPEHIGPVLSDSDHVYLMCLQVGDLAVHCHFFTEDEIELDIDPAEVVSQQHFATLTDFMEGLAKALGKDVILTAENTPSHELLRYDLLAGQILFRV